MTKRRKSKSPYAFLLAVLFLGLDLSSHAGAGLERTLFTCDLAANTVDGNITSAHVNPDTKMRTMPEKAQDLALLMANLRSKMTIESVDFLSRRVEELGATGDTLSFFRAFVDEAPSGLDEVLAKLGHDRKDLMRLLDKESAGLRAKRRSQVPDKRDNLSYFINAVTWRAGEEAEAMGDQFATPAHMLLALVSNEFEGTLLGEFFAAHTPNFRPIPVREQIIVVHGREGIKERSFKLEKKKVAKDADEEPSVDEILIDMTKLAEEGKLKGAVGVEKNIKRIYNILNRVEKSSGCLVGRPGTGKTAIVKELALAIFRGDVPESFLGARLYQLRATNLLSDTKFSGQKQDKIKAVAEFLIESLGGKTTIQSNTKEVLVFIDEIQTIAKDPDILDELKDLLSDGGIRLIAATTFDEYRKFIKIDPAIERRIPPIPIDEPTGEDLQLILGFNAKFLGKGHNVEFTQAAIDRCIVISDRFQPAHLANPDKSIEVMREAASFVDTNAQFLVTYRKRLTEAQEKRKGLGAGQDEEARRLDELIVELTAHVKNFARFESRIVDEDMVVEAYKERSPFAPVMTGEAEVSRAADFAARLGQTVVGQKAALETIGEPLLDIAEGYAVQDGKPISIFVRASSGVGSSHMAAEVARDRGSHIMTVNCGDYKEYSALTRLLGGSQTFIGFEAGGGELTKFMGDHPFGMVVFEEPENGGAEILEKITRIVKEGKLIAGDGSTIDFRNAMIIINSKVDVGDATTSKAVRLKLMQNAKLGGLMKNGDLIVTAMERLNFESLAKIVGIELMSYNQAVLGPNFHTQMTLTDRALGFVVGKRDFAIPGAKDLNDAFKVQVRDMFRALSRKKLIPKGTKEKAVSVKVVEVDDRLYMQFDNGDNFYDIDGNARVIDLSEHPQNLSDSAYMKLEDEKAIEAAKAGAPGAEASEDPMAAMMRQIQQGGGQGAGGPGATGAGEPQGGDKPLIIGGDGGPRRTIERGRGNFSGVNHGVAPQQ